MQCAGQFVSLTDRGKVGLLTNISPSPVSLTPAPMAVHCTLAPVRSGCTPKQCDLHAEIIITRQILLQYCPHSLLSLHWILGSGMKLESFLKRFSMINKKEIFKSAESLLLKESTCLVQACLKTHWLPSSGFNWNWLKAI